MTKKERMQEALRRLKKTYRTFGPFVVWHTPLELVIGTVLSAQCTDERVNAVTKTLFKKYRTARAYARADLRALERDIHSTGFYRSKARYLKGIGRRLTEAYQGKVPDTKEALMTLPGVSHKSANLIMSKVYGVPVGIAVDTHVKRIAPRLGLTKHTAPDKIAKDLEAIVPKHSYLAVNEYLIMHGRAVCKPGVPLCGSCVLSDVCPSAKKFLKK